MMMLATMAMQGHAQTANDVLFEEMDYSPEFTQFRVVGQADRSHWMILRIYDSADATEPVVALNMIPDNDCWVIGYGGELGGDLKGKYYTFDSGHGESPGLFAKAVSVNGKRAAIIDMASTNPEGWEKDLRPAVKSPADLVIYEIHHRDFSVARPDAKYKGKFLALTEPWAIQHLKDLGVNAIHILPSYDYGSVDETRLNVPQYNWGYDPVNYNVPEGSYSTNPNDPACRIREFKQMVQALHKAGIRVILDVVYNHTYDIDHSNFQKLWPDYFYRKTADGHYSNGSGCGNETASEQPIMRQFMMESVKYWIEEYNIDGFRFDLMGCHDIETMNEIRQMVNEIDPSIFIYGEGWSAGACALPVEQLGVKANIGRMPHIAAFSDEIRDALRGPFDNDTKPGMLGGAPNMEESLKFGIVGAIQHPQVDMTKVNYSKEPWAIEPTQMISYVSCHDDMCLVDRLCASVLNTPRSALNAQQESELIRLDLLAQTAVFTSQGVPFMLAGEEVLRTKQGVHNSFESPDSINRIDWANKERYPQVFNYYKNLIQLRKNHPAFRLGSAELVRKHLEFLKSPKGVVAFRLKSNAGGDTWRNIYVVLNASKKTKSITVPKNIYTVICRDGVIDEQGLEIIKTNKMKVGPQSALIIHD